MYSGRGTTKFCVERPLTQRRGEKRKGAIPARPCAMGVSREGQCVLWKSLEGIQQDGSVRGRSNEKEDKKNRAQGQKAGGKSARAANYRKKKNLLGLWGVGKRGVRSLGQFVFCRWETLGGRKRSGPEKGTLGGEGRKVHTWGERQEGVGQTS